MSNIGREATKGAGFGRSDRQSFTIAIGASGSAVAPVDLGRNYAAILILCPDSTGIAASTTLRAEVAYDGDATLYRLRKANDDGGEWVSGVLPDTGPTFSFILTHAFMVQQIRLVLSNNVAGADVTFYVYGLDQGVDNP